MYDNRGVLAHEVSAGRFDLGDRGWSFIVGESAQADRQPCNQGQGSGDARTGEQGAAFVTAATDRGNFPMAANFAKAGYPVVRERINFEVARG